MLLPLAALANAGGAYAAAALAAEAFVSAMPAGAAATLVRTFRARRAGGVACRLRHIDRASPGRALAE